MKALITALVVAWVLPAALAHAGPCADEVAQYRNSLSQEGAGAEAVGSAPQSLSAQLHHQPTPSTVEPAKKDASAKIAAALADAEKLDAEGNQSACEDTLAKAKLLAHP